MTRSQAIAAKCRQCIHDPRAAGTWREQVAICACLDCPLWRYRPLPRNPAMWVALRDPEAVPDGFAGLAHEVAVDCLRRNGEAKAHSAQDFHARLGTQNRGATPVAGRASP